MKPLFVRPLTKEEREALRAGLRSPDSMALRRSQILLLSAEGHDATVIARQLGCATQTVRNTLRAFEQRGLDCLARQSKRPHRIAYRWPPAQDQALRALLHESPRAFGKAHSTWTLDLAAEVCRERGLTREPVSAETLRRALARLGVKWRRAKHWINSPDPQYALKKSAATGYSRGRRGAPIG